MECTVYDPQKGRLVTLDVVDRQIMLTSIC